MSAQEIKSRVCEILESKKKDLLEKRYQMSGMLLGLCKKEIKWADAQILKQEFDDQLLLLLGPKDERDDLKLVVILMFDSEKEGKRGAESCWSS